MTGRIHFTRGFLVGALLVALSLGGIAYAYEEPVQNLSNKALNCTTSEGAVGLGSLSDALIVANPSATPVYLGATGVTSANGFAICTDTTACTRADFSMDGFGKELYCIAGSTVEVRVVEASK